MRELRGAPAAGILPERKRGDRRAHARPGATSTTAVRPDTVQDGVRSEAMAAITELQNFGEALLTKAVGTGVTFVIATTWSRGGEHTASRGV